MEALGLVGSIIAIIGAVSASYGTISKITDLPQAFKKVKEALPLAQKLLDDVETTLRNSRLSEEQRKSVQDILNACNKDAKEMERIFRTLERKFKEDRGATSWSVSVRGWYRTALRSVKAHRVEDLMKSILGGLEKLALNQVFQLATTGDLEAIKTAIDELSTVPPSLDDSEFDAFGQMHAHMDVSDNATAQQINAQGGCHTFNSGRNVFSGPIQSLSFPSTQRQEILELLSSDYEASKDFNVERTRGTCMWIFDDPKFKQWRDSGSSGILWISLGPGCGKTVLSRVLVDDRLGCTTTARTICHFFFRKDDERRIKASQCLCAILHQIFTQTPGANLIRHAVHAYEQHGNMLCQNFSVLWKILVECIRSPESGKIVFIIDALDECHGTARHQLLDKFQHLYREEQSSPRANLNLLITSRPYDDIISTFEEFPATAASRIREDEKIADISRDIDLVIDRQVENLASRLHHRDRQRLSKQLKEMKNRTYLWLHLIFGIIKKRMSAYGKSSSILLLLESIPTEISEAYEEILRRNQDEKLTDTLLRIVLAAVEPLTLQEANIALTLAGKKLWRSIDELEEDMWPSEDFKRIIENATGLFIRGRGPADRQIHSASTPALIGGFTIVHRKPTRQRRGGPKLAFSAPEKEGKLWAGFPRLGTALMGFNRWNDLAAVSHPGLQPVVEEMLSTEGAGDINAPMGSSGIASISHLARAIET
ncbi:hypothetical protein SAPIO_CDS1888 [Scedosporium apiospermum]|uniref:NACHT domain-containing protein n=1 Tax=Pseudallescheria apiosperma TaxID=563466 RepID=A0A084GDZ1_PSEDA|nr:uncharacterized protein SAPIO_CDS1888 [Scedosporium apiospermum]KEZ45553.1 hypothetical protein SAPIO_CDS1888 [Scedosporium apiospermum]